MREYGYMGKSYTKEELQEVVEAEVKAGNDEPERIWKDGEFVFEQWLPEAIDADLVQYVGL